MFFLNSSKLQLLTLSIKVSCPAHFSTHHLSYISFVLHFICPTLHLSYTSFVLHIICPKLYLSYTSSVLHIICPTHHLSYTSFVLHFICPTLHLSNTSLVIHFIFPTLLLSYTLHCKLNISLDVEKMYLYFVVVLVSPVYVFSDRIINI